MSDNKLHTAEFKQVIKHLEKLEGPQIYIDIKRGWFCCKRMMVLAKFHDNMDVSQDGKVSVYAPEDSFWHRQINQDYFKFEFCPYCSKRLYTT